jgi:hypothetical protein
MLIRGGQMIWVGIICIAIAFVVFVHAAEKIKYGEFDDSSWWLAFLGIYQWGQGIVISFWWILFGLGCIFGWSGNSAMRGYLLFHIIRALAELFLLQNQNYQGLPQAIESSIKKISPLQLRMLYQLSQGLLILVGIVFLTSIPSK